MREDRNHHCLVISCPAGPECQENLFVLDSMAFTKVHGVRFRASNQRTPGAKSPATNGCTSRMAALHKEHSPGLECTCCGGQFPWWAALHFRRAKWWLATSPGEMVIKKSTVLEQLFPSPSRTKAIGALCVEEAIPVPHGRSLKGTSFSQF